MKSAPSLVSVTWSPKFLSSGGFSGQVVQLPAKVFAAFCLGLLLCAPIEAIHGAGIANAGVSEPDTVQLSQADDTKLIRNIQDVLGKLGYAAGPANGRLSAQTRKAIAAFQRDGGLPVDGRPSVDVLLAAMRAQVGDTQTLGRSQGLCQIVARH